MRGTTTTSPPPYLCLSVGEAHSYLDDPSEPEPSDHGTLVRLLEHRAKHSGQQVAVGFPSCSGGRSLTWTSADLASVASHAASALRPQIEAALKQGGPRDGDSGQAASHQQLGPIAILGPSGPEFLAHVLACWQLGFAIMPIATGTAAPGVANLLKLTHCKLVIAQDSQKALVNEAVATLFESDITLLPWSSLPSDITEMAATHARIEPLQAVTGDSELVIFHSSGSTGNPKPIPQLHRFWSRSLTTAQGTKEAAFTTTPLFHGGLSDLFRALQAGSPIFFFSWHEGKPPTTANICASVQACEQSIHYFLSVPFLREMLLQDDDGMQMLQRMDLVSTGGAPLPESVGDAMVHQHGISLVSRLESSECGFLMSSWRDFKSDKEWSWLRISDAASKSWLDFQHRPEEGELFELVVKSEWPTKIMSNQPDGSYATSDLYERHPKHNNLWRYARRADDSLVLVNGKKSASSPIEAALKASPLLSDAIVFGANRPMIGAIVLPKPSADSNDRSHHAEVLEKLEPVLDEINKSQPQHAYLGIDMVHIADAKTFADLPRSSKGTLQRGLALDRLADIIDDTYARFERGESRSRSTAQVEVLHGEELRKLVHHTVRDVLGRDIDGSTDFFAAGVDSIKAMRIRATLMNRVDLGGRTLSSNVLYERGNIDSLCAFLGDSTSTSSTSASVDQIAQDLVKRYTTFDQARTNTQTGDPKEGPVSVLVTGGTGALGSRVIASLLRTDRSQVERIYCIARARDNEAAHKRIVGALRTRKCLSEPELGRETGQGRRLLCFSQLSAETSRAVKESTQLVIVHCAWTVNFALSLASFEKDNIAALKGLLDVYLTSKSPKRFVFCSSLASILAGPPPHAEQPSHHIASAGSTGYGQSKWVAEQICSSAAALGCGEVVVARVGQLCGDTEHGIWNETEAYPFLVRTAVEVGCLPSSGPDIDWLPVDTVANTLVDIALSTSAPGSTDARYLHIATPAHVPRPSWADFVKWLGASPPLSEAKVVDKAEWLDAVRRGGARVRGRALIEDIWANLPETGEEPTVSTESAESCSPTLAQASTVDKELCLKFVEAWRSSGFLQ